MDGKDRGSYTIGRELRCLNFLSLCPSPSGILVWNLVKAAREQSRRGDRQCVARHRIEISTEMHCAFHADYLRRCKVERKMREKGPVEALCPG